MAYDANDPNDVAILQAAIDEATKGLKTKNSELIGEQKLLKGKVSEIEAKFEGIGDPAEIKKLLEHLQGSEEAKLIAEGKMDQVIERRTERMRAEYDKKLNIAQKEAQDSKAFASRFKQSLVDSAIREAAIKAGCTPEATDDFILRGTRVFSADDEGNVISLSTSGEATLGKDGKTPLQPAEWVESLRETAPHLWPKATGSGAPGDGGSAANKTYDEMTEAERTDLYRKDKPKWERLRAASKVVKK